MAFTATIVPQDALAPDYSGTKKMEHWTATALASDSGPATMQARHIQTIDDVDVQFFNGTGPTSVAFTGNTLKVYLPGTTTATKYRIRLEGRY